MLLMKKILSIIIISLLLSSVAMANQVELKDFKLGMSKKEFKKTWKSKRVKARQSLTNLIIPHYVITLAGVQVDKQ